MPTKGKILVADDDDVFRESTADLLREEGYECITVPDALAAQGLLQQNSFDLLIVDIRMPGNSEFEFVRNLPNVVPGLQAIVVTGYPSLQTAIQSVELPVLAYLLKPVELSELLAAVEAGVRQRRMTAVLEAMHTRLSTWLPQVEQVYQYHQQFFKSGAAYSAETFIDLTLSNMAGILLDVNAMAGILHGNKKSEMVCSLINCPVQATLKDAIADSINVLEKTKTSFKSKELADLRKRLEEVYRAN
jgi:DNA-binding response OmpR family regulator